MYEHLFQLLEEALKVLANQKRLEIVQLLSNKELTVTDMVEMLGVPQANISQNLSLLRQARIVSTRKDGRHVYYHLTDNRIAAVIQELRAFLTSQHAHDPEISQLNMLDKSIYPIARDPVCGMRLSGAEIGESLVKDGVTYYFCAGGCKEKFMNKSNISGASMATTHDHSRSMAHSGH
jgi:ArsR family transcriptional regulator